MWSAFNVGVVMPCGVACVLCSFPFQFLFRLVTGSYDHEEPSAAPPTITGAADDDGDITTPGRRGSAKKRE